MLRDFVDHRGLEMDEKAFPWQRRRRRTAWLGGDFDGDFDGSSKDFQDFGRRFLELKDCRILAWDFPMI